MGKNIFSFSDKYIIFESLVIKGSDIKKYGYYKILQKIWERNNSVDLVGFAENNKGHLAGQIIQLETCLDYEEFEFYILSLARECDRLEYVLTGEDKY